MVSGGTLGDRRLLAVVARTDDDVDEEGTVCMDVASVDHNELTVGSVFTPIEGTPDISDDASSA